MADSAEVSKGEDTEVTVSTLTIPTWRQVMRYLPGFLLRVVIPISILLFVLDIPIAEKYDAQGVVALDMMFILLWAVIFFFYLRWQIKSIHSSWLPEARWIESLLVMGVLFIAIFARAYRILDLGTVRAFTEPMDTLNSYYFAMTVLSTVGFGDIAPVLAGAKIITMVQMVANFVLLGLLVRVLASAARKAKAMKAKSSD